MTKEKNYKIYSFEGDYLTDKILKYINVEIWKQYKKYKKRNERFAIALFIKKGEK